LNIESLHEIDVISKKVDLVQTICDKLHKKMISMGVFTGGGVSEYAEYLLPLLNDHDELISNAAWMSRQTD
jgi:hypothetical protein